MPKRRKNSAPCFVEVNRVWNDSLERFCRYLENRGFRIELLPHLTSLKIWRPKGMTFAEMVAVLIARLQPGRGSALLFSARTGRAYRLFAGRGGRPGRAVRV